ncbi:hypothetical protein RDABS01_002603 [Bienertia sinuspersici]
MLRGLIHFHKVSGLRANNSKSKVYSANMKEDDVNRICEKTCFNKGSEPFKYLGVPICSRKISRNDCEQLFHRMTANIRRWQTRHISFAGRLQLVNAILMSICTFWMLIFIIPTGVIREINRLCRRFLWEGQLYGKKPSYVSWDQVCKSKSKGGLGVKDLCLWSNIDVGKLVWQIAE